MLDEYAQGFFSNDHYDINKRLRKAIKIENINNTNLQNDLEILATQLNTEINSTAYPPNNNELCYKLTEGIYDVCKKYYTKSCIDTSNIPNYNNCTSKHFKAISEANI